MYSTVRTTRVVAAAWAAILLLAEPAAAHPVLDGSQPDQGERVVEPPAVVELQFSEPVTATDVSVTSPEGRDVTAGSPQQVEATVRQSLAAPPEQGQYTIRYEVAAADDHLVTGELTFTYAGPIGDEPDPDPAVEDAGTDVEEDESDDGASLVGLWPLLLLAFLAAAGGAVAVRAFRSVRTPADDA